jgi:hypothetical protein
MTMLSFCNRACIESFMATPEPAEPTRAAARCASCEAVLKPSLPPITSEGRALLVELHRVTNGRGPVLERALASLDRESVHALRLVIRDLEFGRTELRSKARRLGLGGLL